jgi:dolichyl-phosphate beta-glucosyltransferase
VGQRIQPFLEAVCGHLTPRRGWEVLVVDDASDDDTCARVLAHSFSWPNLYLLRNPAKLGCGYASRHGVHLARGARIALVSPDFPAPIGMLDRLDEAISGGYDLAFVSRRTEHDRPLPPVRIRDEIVRSILDTPRRANNQEGPQDALLFQLYRRRAAIELFGRQRLHGSGFAVEILYLARRFGYEVLEVGISGGRKDLAHAGEVGELLRIRMHRLRGDYG